MMRETRPQELLAIDDALSDLEKLSEINVSVSA